MAQHIDAAHPTIARWVKEFGWIEIGQDHLSRSLPVLQSVPTSHFALSFVHPLRYI
jgi:hypothetical protein